MPHAGAAGAIVGVPAPQLSLRMIQTSHIVYGRPAVSQIPALTPAEACAAGNVPLFRADCELAQVSAIINVLGSYQPELWGGAHLLPDYGKILLADSAGIPLPEMFADATPAAIDVLAALLSCVLLQLV